MNGVVCQSTVPQCNIHPPISSLWALWLLHSIPTADRRQESQSDRLCHGRFNVCNRRKRTQTPGLRTANRTAHTEKTQVTDLTRLSYDGLSGWCVRAFIRNNADSVHPVPGVSSWDENSWEWCSSDQIYHETWKSGWFHYANDLIPTRIRNPFHVCQPCLIVCFHSAFLFITRDASLETFSLKPLTIQSFKESPLLIQYTLLSAVCTVRELTNTHFKRKMKFIHRAFHTVYLMMPPTVHSAPPPAASTLSCCSSQPGSNFKHVQTNVPWPPYVEKGTRAWVLVTLPCNYRLCFFSS